MASSRLARRYAKALIEMAVQHDTVERITADVRELLANIAASRELSLLFQSPVIKPELKKKVIGEIYSGKLNDLTLMFMEVVIDKRREQWIADMLNAYVVQYNELKGIVPVNVITATEMNEELEAEFKAMMQKEFGINKMEMSKEVNREIIGGFILQFEDKRYDASVQNMLDQIRKDLHNQVNVKMS